MSFLFTAWGFLKGIPWQAYVIALLLALYPAAYCKGRADGVEKRDAYWKAEIAQANEKALKKAQEAKRKAEQRYAEKAKEIEDEARKEIAAANDDAEQFIAVGGVRRDGACPTGRAASPAKGNGTGHSEGAGSTPVMDGLISVYPEDVRICTENTVKAEAGHAFALSFEEGE